MPTVKRTHHHRRQKAIAARMTSILKEVAREMSDTPAGPLWSDRYIDEEIDRKVASYGGNAKVAARQVAKTMRNDYEHEREPLLARIAELQRELDAARGERWVPLANGKHDKVAGRTKVEVRADMLILENRDSILTAELRDGIRLCKRVAQEGGGDAG